jgi:hypothetical protein
MQLDFARRWLINISYANGKIILAIAKSLLPV